MSQHLRTYHMYRAWNSADCLLRTVGRLGLASTYSIMVAKHLANWARQDCHADL
jgi:hypothetical protein